MFAPYYLSGSPENYWMGQLRQLSQAEQGVNLMSNTISADTFTIDTQLGEYTFLTDLILDGTTDPLLYQGAGDMLYRKILDSAVVAQELWEKAIKAKKKASHLQDHIINAYQMRHDVQAIGNRFFGQEGK